MPRTHLTSSRTARIALGAVAAAVAVGALIDVRAGALLLAAVTLAGAVTRLTLPAGRAFSVRRRYVDVTVLTGLAVVLTFLALTTPLR